MRKGRAGGRPLSRPFRLVLHRSVLFFDKLSSKNRGETSKGNSHSTAMLLGGMAEGQEVLSSREQMNVGESQPQSPDRYLGVLSLLLPPKTLASAGS